MWEQYEVGWDDISLARREQLICELIQNHPEIYESDEDVNSYAEAVNSPHIRAKSEGWFIDHQPYYID